MALPADLSSFNRVFGMCRGTKSSFLFSSEAVKCSFKKRVAKCFRYAGIRFNIFNKAAMMHFERLAEGHSI